MISYIYVVSYILNQCDKLNVITDKVYDELYDKIYQ